MKIRINTKSYVISVSYDKGCYRHIRISGKATLEDLSDAILDAFDFDNDHLHAFFMTNRAWDNEECYSSRYAEDGFPDTDNCRLQFIGLEVGKKFRYIFDFGDEWRFQCKILSVLNEDVKKTEVVRSKGEAPQQYPDYDEDDEYCDDDDFLDDCFDDNDCDEGMPKLENLPLPVPDELYETALRFKKVKLWNKLYDTDIFAVKLSNGENGYCLVTGRIGEYFALSLYIGKKGLLSYYRISNPMRDRNEDEHFERSISQDCLQVCFDNKDALSLAELNSAQDYAERNGVNFRGTHSYPSILRMKPFYAPWYIEDENEFVLLREALEAAIFVSEKLKGNSPKKLGFTESAEIPYIIPNGDSFEWQTLSLPEELTEELPAPLLSASKISELKSLKQLNKWECKVIYLKNPIQERADEAAYFPAILIAVECRNDHILPVEPVHDYNENAQVMLDSLADEFLRYKRLPKTIYVSDDRTYSLLMHLCEDCGIELKTADVLNKADDFGDNLNEMNISDEAESFMQLISMLESLSLNELSTMPPELKEICRQMMNEGLIEPDLQAKLNRAFNIK